VTCFLLTVFFDMVVAISVGVVLAALLFMRRMAELTEVKLTAPETHGDGPTDLPKTLAGKVALYEIGGPLFFGAAQKAMASLGSISSRVEVVILRLEAVPVMDATGLVALESAIASLTKRGCVAILTGLRPQPAELLERAGFRHKPWRLMMRPDLASAIATAEELVTASPRKTGQVSATEIDARPPGAGEPPVS
jgi:SulP family sulfate permease